MPKDVSTNSPMDKKQSVLEEMLILRTSFRIVNKLRRIGVSNLNPSHLATCTAFYRNSRAVIQGRVIVPGMTRGNQREQDRQKAQKKAAAQAKKPKESASTLAKRKEADAEILRAKQKKAQEDKAGSSSGK